MTADSLKRKLSEHSLQPHEQTEASKTFDRMYAALKKIKNGHSVDPQIDAIRALDQNDG